MRDPNTPINTVGKALYGEFVGDTDEAGDDIHVMVGAEGYKFAEIAIGALKNAGFLVVPSTDVEFAVRHPVTGEPKFARESLELCRLTAAEHDTTILHRHVGAWTEGEPT